MDDFLALEEQFHRHLDLRQFADKPSTSERIAEFLLASSDFHSPWEALQQYCVFGPSLRCLYPNCRQLKQAPKYQTAHTNAVDNLMLHL